MAKSPILPPNRDSIVEKDGTPSRPFWRFLNSLVNNNGTLANPVVVSGNAVLNEVSIESGGTISSPDLPPSTLVGNGGATAAQPSVVTVGASLSLTDDVLSLALLPGGTLFGNSGALTSVPEAITVGDYLSFSSGQLSFTVTNLTAMVETLGTTVPTVSGQLWNNGGVICLS